MKNCGWNGNIVLRVAILDKVEIIVKSGDGGHGAISFWREKFVPLGGPDGGDGGNGGEVIIMANPSFDSLEMFRRRRFYRAGNGRDGKGKKQHGEKGTDLILNVPPGTVLWQKTTSGEVMLADLEQPGEQVMVAQGGKGGFGNTHFVSSTNQAPRIAQKGVAGEEKSLILELRLIADVGIVGYPNVGKSTLLTAASAARPKIASYLFTTLAPVLGVVEVGLKRFTLAEIPGLVEDAHLGRGLGHDFLQHMRRTKMLIHLIDGTSMSPVEDMVMVNAELGLFDPSLARKPQLVVLNKVDLPEVQRQIAEIKEAFRQAGVSISFISAAQREGVSELMVEVMRMLEKLASQVLPAKKIPAVVFRPQPRDVALRVAREGDVFILLSPEVERIVARVDMTYPGVRWQVKVQLAKMGLTRVLEKAGVKPGDKVRCGDTEWEW